MRNKKKKIVVHETRKIEMNIQQMLEMMKTHPPMPLVDFLKMLENTGKTSLHSVIVGEEEDENDDI